MELDNTDMLQINATVMVGVLILLTLGTLRHLNTAATLLTAKSTKIKAPPTILTIMLTLISLARD